jgi:hypothetical protein
MCRQSAGSHLHLNTRTRPCAAPHTHTHNLQTRLQQEADRCLHYLDPSSRRPLLQLVRCRFQWLLAAAHKHAASCRQPCSTSSTLVSHA